LGAHAWYRDNADLSTHEVGKLKENIWGVHDTLGNVWEWCEDWYDKDYFASSPKVEPAGPSSGDKKVTRGGSFASGPEDCSSSMRGSDPPTHKGPNIGFRLVMTIE
jgi:formylglycine-generating enzyme required for sulfatase activity